MINTLLKEKVELSMGNHYISSIVWELEQKLITFHTIKHKNKSRVKHSKHLIQNVDY